MKSCIISIGDELIRGLTVNTNASAIALSFLDAGYSPSRVVTIGDEQESMKHTIADAAKSHDVIILTGGLGPTSDDLTRQVLSDLFNRPLEESKEMKYDLEKRYGVGAPTLDDQAMVLKGAKIYLNPLGTAPGFSLEEGKSLIIVLPGPPSQMQAVLSLVIKDVIKTFPPVGIVNKRYLSLISESEIDPFIREWEPKVEGLSIGVCPDYGTLAVYFWFAANIDKGQVKGVLEAFDQQYVDHIYSSESKLIELAVIDELKKQKKSLSLAESCTGGLALSRLTDIPGASDVITGGWVSYNNRVKNKWLGVLEEDLNKYGAVSLEVACAMAKGALNHSDSDFAIGITGIAGPGGGSATKPVGSVCVAIATREGSLFSTQFLAKGRGSRLLVKTYTVNFVLSGLFRYIKGGRLPFEEK